MPTSRSDSSNASPPRPRLSSFSRLATFVSVLVLALALTLALTLLR